MFGTMIDVTKFYWTFRMPQEVWDLFCLDGVKFQSLPFGSSYSALISQETLGDLLR